MPNEQLTFEDMKLEDVQSHEMFEDLAPHIVSRFWVYHRENPHVFKLFSRFAMELQSRGRRHYGAKAIAERIRWHMALETVGDDFKLGNNYIACYARLLAIEHPAFKTFFQFRSTPGRVRNYNG